MSATREGKLRFLVATDVAARGIDISHLTHVINYDFPESAEQYVHRTGRTGRAGRTGTAISLIGPKDIGNLYLLRLTYKIRPIEKQLPSAGEMKTRAETDLVAMFADAFATRPAHPDDLVARAAAAHARRRPRRSSPASCAITSARERKTRRPRPPKRVARRTRRPKRAPRRPPRCRRSRRPRRVHPRRRARSRSRLAPRERERERERVRATRAARRSSTTTSRSSPASPSPCPTKRPAPIRSRDDFDEPGFSRIFVNIGRRDGARAQDLQKLLTDGAGIARHDTGRIRIRDRVTFVSVRPDDMSKAIAALAGKVIGGRTVVAEPAKAKAGEAQN